ncbi:heterokaryon incompatibility protein-domain-containing protein [Cladorrhinum samala]|uniref:Heterokaryon incompatibility protein-domain-containing protein n=1 Tax=Cladorrhinum samala TaxID=585594 RepID=A0AAV9I567_9PEZI|nr:heterokaryon incompatibility protein-domain-containing protein [Cladorrhinum samala]
MVCVECREFLRPRYRINTTGSEQLFESKFSRSVPGLRSNSASCSICEALVRKLPSSDAASLQVWREKPSFDHRDDVARYTAMLNESRTVKGTYRLSLRLDRVGRRQFRGPLQSNLAQKIFSELLLVPLSRTAEICGDEGSSQVSRTTACPSALNTAKNWLQKCLLNHPSCRVALPPLEGSQKLPFLPTRVIRILPKAIQLYTTNGSEGDDFRYATLSHRWPLTPDSLLQLTTDHVHQWHSGIEQGGTFSTVFRDAIAVCRHLAIENLWIDSLCIIQRGDNGQDWQREAARMGDVYKHGLVNIAATSVVDGEEGLQKGFFRSRDSSLVSPNIITASCNYEKQTRRDGVIGDLVNASRKGHAELTDYFVIAMDQVDHHVVNAPLNQRAWVMQERHMAPRVLHFTEHQIFWECNETVCSETYPKAEPVELFRELPRSKTFLGRIAADRLSSSMQLPLCIRALPTNPHHIWYELVSVYSRGGLTKTTDKLIALSGVAREIMPHLGAVEEDYLAGLWCQDLIYGLLWKPQITTGEEARRTRPDNHQPYQAPSWSWASVNWPVHFNYQLHNSPHDVLATIEEVQVASKLDPFGEIYPGACLKIKGTVYKARLQYARFAGRDWPELTIGTALSKISTKFKGSFQILPDESFVDGQSRERNDVRLLPILQSKQKSTTRRQRPGSWAWLVMLLLVPTDRPDEYKRFGLVELRGNGSDTVLELGMVGKRISDPREETVTIV